MKIHVLFAIGLLGAPAFAQVQSSAPPGARISTILNNGAPTFDSGRSGAPEVLPDAPKPQPKKKPEHTALEKGLYDSTAWGYHAAFVADFTTTGMVLGRGGHETDPLYTRFGNKNMKGVIGSAVAVHAAATLGSLALYKEAAKTHGLKRVLLDTAAIGINAYGIGAHTQGASHNVGVLQNWNSPR